MAKLAKDTEEKIGAAPGTLFIKKAKSNIKGFIIKYNAYEYTKRDLEISELAPNLEHEPRYDYWYHFEGFAKEDFFAAIKESFHIPSLQLADLANTNHHPKFEDLKDQLFFLLKTVTLNEVANMIEFNHFGVFVGEDYVLTFSEKPTTFFNNIIGRLEKGYGTIRSRSEDYLFYALLDAVVDQYLAVADGLGMEVEELQLMISQERYKKNLTKNILELRTEFLLLARLFGPIRDGIQLMINHQAELFEEDLSEFLNDLKDHVTQVENTTSSYRALAGDLLDIYATNINLRTNRIITFLTVYSTIFIPLTFITGLYGMNFKYMPELDAKYAYPIVLMVMLLVTIAMVTVFKKKKWI